MSAFRPQRPPLPARLFRAGAAVLALLAAAAAPVRAGEYLNPAAIVLGGTATFRVDIAPDAFPDAAIHWTADPATRVSFPSGSSGRTVTVRGNAPGDVLLRVEIDGYTGEHPVANARVVPLSIVKADAWIIGDGGVWARTEDEVRGIFDDVNDIFSQIGVVVSLDSISFTNHTGWLNFNPRANNWAVPNQITSITNGTGGLVYYFVGNMGSYYGLHNGGDILIKNTATGVTVAHEAGHAFGLSDIYTAQTNETALAVSPALEPTLGNMPNDWGSDSALGFYSAGLTHSDIVTRLLMYGEGDSGDGAGIDLSYGDVYGLWYEWVQHQRQWQLSLAPVGFFQHANPGPYLK